MPQRKVLLGDLLGWKNYRRYRFLLHLLVWTSYIFIYAYIYALIYPSVNLKSSLVQYTITGWIDVAAAYFLVYFLFPRFIFKKKMMSFFLWLYSPPLSLYFCNEPS